MRTKGNDMALTTARIDRACGVLLATAAGDALGAPYEFQPARGKEKDVAMVGGGGFGWAPGEWTDDTSMAIAIAEVAATGADLRDDAAQNAIVERWYGWSRSAKDVGVQTSNVLGALGAQGVSAANAKDASRRLHERTGHTAGNGSLMRTAPVALAYLDDEAALVVAARAVSELTHFDPDAGDACVLWCCAIRHAVLTGALDVRIGLRHLDRGRRDSWSARIDAAESARPSEIPRNGWVVAALQAAWSAITTTDTGEGLPADHLARGWTPRCGRATTPTPSPRSRAACSVRHTARRRCLRTGGACCTAGQGCRRVTWWHLPAGSSRRTATFRAPPGAAITARHPYDGGVWLGDAAALLAPPKGVDAIVSLCRVHDDDLPAGVEQIDVRLIDREGAEANPNLDFVLADTVRMIEQLRAEGRTVLVHCFGAYSRTPTIGALYGAHVRGVNGRTALADVLAVLPDADPNPAFRRALNRLAP